MISQINKVILVVMFMNVMLSLTATASVSTAIYSDNNRPHQAFILFYMSSCPHCRKFDPILKQYARSHHMPVLAYTLDRQALPSFPNSVIPSQQEIQRFFPRESPVVPALFLMDFDQQRIYPVLKGEATPSQLDQRIRAVTEAEVNYAQ